MGNLVPTQNVTETTRFVEDKGWARLMNFGDDFLDVIFSDEFFVITDSYTNFLSIKSWASILLSIQSVVLNFILLLNLFLDSELRQLQFYPVMLQAFCDLLGPGIANVIYELRVSYDNFFLDGELEFFSNGWPLSSVNRLQESTNDILSCILMYLRVFLNETSTGICVCAVGLYRYIVVCHPLKKVTVTFHRVSSAVVTLFVVFALVAITVDIWNNSQYKEVTYNHERFRCFQIFIKTDQVLSVICI